MRSPSVRFVMLSFAIAMAESATLTLLKFSMAAFSRSIVACVGALAANSL